MTTTHKFPSLVDAGQVLLLVKGRLFDLLHFQDQALRGGDRLQLVELGPEAQVHHVGQRGGVGRHHHRPGGSRLFAP